MDDRRALIDKAKDIELALWELAKHVGIAKTEKLSRYLDECAVGKYPLPRPRVPSFWRFRPTKKIIRLEMLMTLSVTKRVQIGWTEEYPEGIPYDEIWRYFQSVTSAIARIKILIKALSIKKAEDEKLREARSKGGRITGAANHKKALMRRERILSLYESLISAGENPRRIVSHIAKAEGITPRRVRQVLAEEESHKS